MEALWRQMIEGITTHPARIVFAVIDLALLIFLIWRLFLILRGTKGVAVLYILAALLVVQVAGRNLPMPFLNALFQLLAPMLLVAFPVVFQPELRRAFEQMGRGSILSRLLTRTHPEEARFINAILQAATEMARGRVGGLIVLERDDDLGDIAATGVRLDAAITPELIHQVFAPRGPLHDGALLIKGQRIHAASCLLPLSDRADLSTHLGTRHRAGLGMAETSDAVVIIVSEEKGTMSLAVDGRLEERLTPERMTTRLTQLLLESGREQVIADIRQSLQRRRRTAPRQ